MAVNIPGVISMAFFYLLVLGTGIWASFKSRREQKKSAANEMEMALLGNRHISWVVGIFTMTGGLVFAKPMRERNYVTMLDPFHFKYGKVLTAVLSLASIFMDVVWVPTTLIGLGGTMSVVLDVSYTICIWLSAAIAIIYTLTGGLYSVAYTDIIQLVLIFLSMWICVPFILMNPNCLDISQTLMNNTLHAPWIGAPGLKETWIMIDDFLFLTGTLTSYGSISYERGEAAQILLITLGILPHSLSIIERREALCLTSMGEAVGRSGELRAGRARDLPGNGRRSICRFTEAIDDRLRQPLKVCGWLDQAVACCGAMLTWRRLSFSDSIGVN
ncbi:high-affinity choline transporter 1-like isoform X2 [Lates japonicus]|uniref:High-affinity choline transporter 1-like isoform X2 n=1 Tax=Lates japonicus TaxID=270547 RepID=A0AAD3NLC5_LATJO|nr:high-affinity choline transporter 1-like isoform X2 [Lates japonicus]